MASDTAGFLGAAGRAATWPAGFCAGAVGDSLADEGWPGFAGVVCGVTLRDTGRGLGRGTANTVLDSSRPATAPASAALQRLNRGDEGANGVTGGLCGESFKCLRLKL